MSLFETVCLVLRLGDTVGVLGGIWAGDEQEGVLKRMGACDRGGVKKIV